MGNYSFKNDLVRVDPVRAEWEKSEHEYEDFVQCVNSVLDETARDIEDNVADRCNDNEDRTTEELKTNLRRKNLFDTVEHDAKTGGHTDIVVRLGCYSWKAESKIFDERAYSWLYKGFLQLTRRYTTGSKYDTEGALIIYIKKPNTKKIMESWREKLNSRVKYNFDLCECSNNELAFISQHEHIKSGKPYNVRHIPINLYHPTLK